MCICCPTLSIVWGDLLCEKPRVCFQVSQNYEAKSWNFLEIREGSRGSHFVFKLVGKSAAAFPRELWRIHEPLTIFTTSSKTLRLRKNPELGQFSRCQNPPLLAYKPKQNTNTKRFVTTASTTKAMMFRDVYI